MLVTNTDGLELLPATVLFPAFTVSLSFPCPPPNVVVTLGTTTAGAMATVLAEVIPAAVTSTTSFPELTHSASVNAKSVTAKPLIVSQTFSKPILAVLRANLSSLDS
jgi:hypothetical protein